MDFTVEYILCFNEILKQNAHNKQYIQYQLNRNVISLLRKRKQLNKPKILEVIDLDYYKPMSLRERIILKQKRNANKDEITKFIERLQIANNNRATSLETYKKYPIYEYRHKRYNIVRCSLFYKDEALFNYKKYKPITYDLIIRILLMSKNLKNFKKSYDNKKMLFKLRCCKKLINFMYIPKNRNIKIDINDSIIKLLNEPIVFD